MNNSSQYKYSQNEIIGDVFTDWDIRPLKYIATQRDKKNNDDIERRMLSVSQYHGIVEKEYDNEEQRRTDEESENYWVVEDKNLVANTMWLNFRGVGVSNGISGYVSPAYRVYQLDEDIVEPRFIHHLMRSDLYVGIYTKHLKGIRPNSLQVSTYDFRHIDMLLPSKEEQKLISRYLDKKTKQIDSLIEKIQKKIKLLKEQRISLINQYVTKGLAPNIEMKDSGVEWIGEIPKHWKRVTNKRLFSEYFGGSWGEDPRENQTDNLVKVIRVTEFDFPNLVVTNDIPTTRSLKIQPDSKKLVKRNDLILEKSGGGKKTPVGRVVLVENEPDILTINSNFTNLCRPNINLVTPRYLVYLLFSSYVQGQTIRNIKQTIGIQNLDLDGFMSEITFIPNLEEQIHTTRYLDKYSKQTYEILKKLEKRNELLREYRQSLISTAVTGKVRITEDMI